MIAILTHDRHIDSMFFCLFFQKGRFVYAMLLSTCQNLLDHSHPFLFHAGLGLQSKSFITLYAVARLSFISAGAAA